MEVQIISRKLITPSSPTPHHLRTLGLSCFDQLMPPVYVPCIFYYSSRRQDHPGVDDAERMIKQLQKSLSDTLSLFYPLAGSYTQGSLSVDCDDRGAEFMEARVSGCLSDHLKEGILETELRNLLVPGPFQPQNIPLVLVQFNLFECGGVAIGTCIAHTVADGFTMFSFVDAWAKTCRLGGIHHKAKLPCFPLASLCPPVDLSEHQAVSQAPASIVTDTKIVTRRFVFGGETISKLKTSLSSVNYASDAESQKCEPTRVEVVAATIWKALIMVSQATHDCSRPFILTLPFNMRGKTRLPVDEDCFGNFVCPVIAQFMTEEGKDMQLQDFVGRVHDAIRRTAADCGKATSGNELFSVTNGKEKMNQAVKMKADISCFSSWCRFPLYEADFGWGRPDWVSSSDPSAKVVILMDAKDGNGIEAWVGLDENSMALFEQDEDILAFTAHGKQLRSPES